MLDCGTTAWWSDRVGGVMSRLLGLSRLSAVLFLLVGLVVAPVAPAQAASKLRVEIDLSSQTMRVDGGFFNRHNWRVSTARPGYRTPVGKFRPIRLERIWYSSKYENSPMPYSIFFLGGYAIHGTYEVRRLGRAVSHGCVRLAPHNARKLFELVKSYGRANTVISIRH
jgi:lipoprotein-anchoring transpeptidase ErfK/SrfK